MALGAFTDNLNGVVRGRQEFSAGQIVTLISKDYVVGGSSRLIHMEATPGGLYEFLTGNGTASFDIAITKGSSTTLINADSIVFADRPILFDESNVLPIGSLTISLRMTVRQAFVLPVGEGVGFQYWFVVLPAE